MARDHVTTLESLLSIEPTGLDAALDLAASKIAAALECEKVDAFMLNEAGTILIARGTSETPLGRKQRALGLDHMPIANRGRVVEAYESGVPYIDGHVERDTEELLGIREGLGIRSNASVPFLVNGVRRGVLLAASLQNEHFTQRDHDFLLAAARWLGMIAHHAELVEELAQDAAGTGRRLAAEELITVLAHDLRNYLSPLEGSVELILARAERDRRTADSRDAARAKRNLARIKRMINALLDVARIDQGLFMLSPVPMDLVALVRDILANMATPDHELALDAPEELALTADPERIGQILENLLSNAIRHSPKGSPVGISIHSELRGSASVAVLSVSDRGPGVAPELAASMFERHTTGSGSKGLGLGLYLAKRLAVEHGGTLSLDPAHQPGAKFVLELPIDEE